MKDRAADGQISLNNKLVRLSPAAALACLQEIIAGSPLPLGDSLHDRRLLRILSVKLLPWIVDRDPSLGATVLLITMSLLDTEADPFARRQALANLGGVELRASAGVTRDYEGGPEIVREFFYLEPNAAPGPIWLAALKRFASEDANVLARLSAIAGDRKDRSQLIAVEALLNLGSDASTQTVFRLFREDFLVRSSCVEGLLRLNKDQALQAFVDVLPFDRSGMTVSQMARQLSRSPAAPAGAGDALLRSFRYFEAGRNFEGESMTRGALGHAAAVIAGRGDRAAQECLALALNEASPRVVSETTEAIIKSPSPIHILLLQKAVNDNKNAFAREILGYALRKSDPTSQRPNLFWDLEKLEQDLTGTTVESERVRLKQLVQEKRDQVSSLRESP